MRLAHQNGVVGGVRQGQEELLAERGVDDDVRGAEAAAAEGLGDARARADAEAGVAQVAQEVARRSGRRAPADGDGEPSGRDARGEGGQVRAGAAALTLHIELERATLDEGCAHVRVLGRAEETVGGAAEYTRRRRSLGGTARWARPARGSPSVRASPVRVAAPRVERVLVGALFIISRSKSMEQFGRMSGPSSRRELPAGKGTTMARPSRRAVLRARACRRGGIGGTGATGKRAGAHLAARRAKTKAPMASDDARASGDAESRLRGPGTLTDAPAEPSGPIAGQDAWETCIMSNTRWRGRARVTIRSRKGAERDQRRRTRRPTRRGARGACANGGCVSRDPDEASGVNKARSARSDAVKPPASESGRHRGQPTRHRENENKYCSQGLGPGRRGASGASPR